MELFGLSSRDFLASATASIYKKKKKNGVFSQLFVDPNKLHTELESALDF